MFYNCKNAVNGGEVRHEIYHCRSRGSFTTLQAAEYIRKDGLINDFSNVKSDKYFCRNW